MRPDAKYQPEIAVIRKRLAGDWRKLHRENPKLARLMWRSVKDAERATMALWARRLLTLSTCALDETHGLRGGLGFADLTKV